VSSEAVQKTNYWVGGSSLSIGRLWRRRFLDGLNR